MPGEPHVILIKSVLSNSAIATIGYWILTKHRYSRTGFLALPLPLFRISLNKDNVKNATKVNRQLQQKQMKLKSQLKAIPMAAILIGAIVFGFFATGCEDDPLLEENPGTSATGSSYGKMHSEGFDAELDSLLRNEMNPETF